METQMHYISEYVWGLQTTPWWQGPSCLSPWLSKMAESAPVTNPCIISWQPHINNKAHNAKCECWCLRKDAQQVHLSSLAFHFVQQRACLYEWLLSESFAWSFFYVPECTTFTGPHDNRLVGTERKERDACQSGYIPGRPEGDGSEHDTSVTGHWETPPVLLPPRRLMVVKSERAVALVWVRTVVVKSIRGHKRTWWVVDW